MPKKSYTRDPPWTVHFFNERVQAELLRLPTDMVAKYVRIAELIERHGPSQVREPYTPGILEMAKRRAKEVRKA